MGYFDRFRRNKSVNIDEVDSYYEKPQRRNPLIAILLGIVSFLVTLALLWLLFIGGRWVYRQIMGNEKSQQNTNQQQADTSKTEKDNNQTNQGGNTSSTSTTTPSGGSSNAVNPSGTGGNSSGQTNNNATTTPAPGDNTVLPRTGDEGL